MAVRSVGVCAIWICCWGHWRTADAQPAAPLPAQPTAEPPKHDAPYPSTLVDRPLVLPSGATFFDLSFEFPTYVVRKTDAMGMVSYHRTGFADRWTPDLDISHAFGPVEVIAGLGWAARIGANVATGTIPGDLYFTAEFYPRQRDGRYAHLQTVGADHRFVVRPHELAIGVAASVTFSEGRGPDESGMLVKGYEVSGYAGASAYYQIAPWLCATAGPSAGTPIYKSVDFDEHAYLGVHSSLVATTRKWDFFVYTSLGDITRRPSTFVNFGFAKRWGL